MEDLINALPDHEAVRLLGLLTDVREAAPPEVGLTPEVRAALAEAFGVAPTAEPVGEGALARAALLVYAQDPTLRAGLDALLHGPRPEAYDFGATVAVTTAVLVLLQTHVRFARDKKGKWTILIEKKPTTPALLKPLVAKLLAFAGR